ncbi:MAG: pectin acetylesterase-family hydrolase [Hyphomonadaceae bacterium]
MIRRAVVALALTMAGFAGSAHAQSRDAPSARPSTTNGWERVAPEPIRVDGRTVEATCSGAPGTDPAFSFWIKRGRSDRLVVYFDGGGACWDDITCAIPRLARDRREEDGFYKAELIDNDDPNRFNGIFADNARNPVRDWTIVYVPYCTGDVHMGSNTATYTDPDTGAPYTIQHRGADNFRVVLAWMRRNLELDPAQLLVAGSSAGAYGAAAHFALIRDVYPRGRALLLGDAGQGVTTQDFMDARTRSWRPSLPRVLVSRGGAQADDMVALLAARYPNDRFAQYTTVHDITQSGFYALMGVEDACTAWTNTMLRELGQRQRAANFRAYVAAGQTHTILRSQRFYAERTAGDVSVSEWLAAMLSDSGSGWDNVVCEDCLVRRDPCAF